MVCTSVCFKSAIISVLIAQSHSDDNHVNATGPKAAGRNVQAKGTLINHDLLIPPIITANAQ